METKEQLEFENLLKQLRGEKLSNVIEYWCMANNTFIDIDDTETYDSIRKKADEIIKIIILSL